MTTDYRLMFTWQTNQKHCAATNYPAAEPKLSVEFLLLFSTFHIFLCMIMSLKCIRLMHLKLNVGPPPLDGPRATHHSLAKSPISWYIFSSSPNLDPRPWGEYPRWKRGDGFPWGKFQPRLWQQFYSFDLVFMLPCWARRLHLQVCYRGVRLWSRTHTHTHLKPIRQTPHCVWKVCHAY